MTCKRRDNGSTPFSSWLYQQNELDSKNGFVATDIDFIWQNYNTGEFMILEEKRFGKDVTYPQRQLFLRLNNALKNMGGFCGFHLLQFEHTNPEDGKIFLDRKEITKTELIKFLQFNRARECQV